MQFKKKKLLSVLRHHFCLGGPSCFNPHGTFHLSRAYCPRYGEEVPSRKLLPLPPAVPGDAPPAAVVRRQAADAPDGAALKAPALAMASVAEGEAEAELELPELDQRCAPDKC